MKSGRSSKYNNRILFLVDHKHRDLPSLSLIGYFLRQMGYEVEYVALWQEDAAIRTFNPRYLALPKPLYAVERLFRFKIEGRTLIVVDTEGNPKNSDRKMNIRVPPDLYFFWNKVRLQMYAPALARAGTRLKLAGFPRGDFLHDRISGVFPARSVLAEQHGMSPDRKTITIATMTTAAHYSEERIRERQSSINRHLTEPINYRDTVNHLRLLRDVTQEMIYFITSNYPDFNILVKPHPNESIFFWRDLVASLPAANIRLCVGEPINHLLRMSDLHISHSACTTTIESLLAGVPAVEIHAGQTQDLAEADHLQLATYTVKTVEELDQVIRQELYQGEKGQERQKRLSQQDAKLQTYISKYFYKFDGLRCYEYAREIDAFVKHSGQESTYYGQFLVNHPEYVLPYLKAQARRPVVHAKKFVKKLLNNRNSQGSGADVCSSDTLVNHLGKYDNRIKSGDEEYWFKRFEQAGLRIEEFEAAFLELA